MNHSKKNAISILAVMGLALAACASAPPAAKTAAAPPTPAQAAAIAATASGARPEFPGFTLTVRKGVELYCQKRNPTGSRARVVEACYTRDQMVKMTENSDEFFKQAAADGSHDSLRTDSPR